MVKKSSKTSAGKNIKSGKAAPSHDSRANRKPDVNPDVNPDPKTSAEAVEPSASYEELGYDIDAVMHAFSDELASVGWAQLDLASVAMRADFQPGEMLRFYDTKNALLAGFQYHIDTALMSQVDPLEDDESVRDRLFDILMQRFDLLNPHKAGLIRLSRELPRDPLAFLGWAQRLRRSMAWILAAAGGAFSGDELGIRALPGAHLCQNLITIAQTKALITLWILTSRTWMSDETEDLAKTMAALDKNLARAEEAVQILEKIRTRRP